MTGVLDLVAGAAGLYYFVAISLATRQHFRSDRYPAGMYVISVLSVLGIAVFLTHALRRDLDYPLLTLAMTMAAQLLFSWAIRHSREQRLTLALDSQMTPGGIIRTGPWKYMRHPFYASYVIFWLACALGTQNLVSVIVFLTLLGIYVYSARREERALATGPLAQDYLEYRRQVGFFFPKLPVWN